MFGKASYKAKTVAVSDVIATHTHIYIYIYIYIYIVWCTSSVMLE